MMTDDTQSSRGASEVAGTACYLIGLASAITINLDAEMREQMALFEARYSVPSTHQREGE